MVDEPVLSPAMLGHKYGSVQDPRVVKDGLLWTYYGCCDAAIGLATVPLRELVGHIFATGPIST